MDTTLQHAKVTTTEPDGKITENVYTDKLRSSTIRTEKKIKSSIMTLLTDHVECLSVIKHKQTDELDINIKVYPDGEIMITKTWTVQKDLYAK